MVHVDGPVGLDGVAVAFDDERAVADAGIVLAATLAGRLGIEALVDARVDLGERAGSGQRGCQGDDAGVGDGAATGVRAAIEAINEADWQTLPDYPKTSIAQIAETTLNDRRLVVRRVRALDRQGQLLPTWELFPFVTNRSDDLALVEAEHRQHAVVELAIRDLKDQALAHFPSGRFYANAAWTVIAALAHNLLRWTSVIGLPG